MHPNSEESTVVDSDHRWQIGDLGLLKGHKVILLDVQQSVWISQNGDCGYWPASEVTFVCHTGLVYRYIHWKETIVDWFAGTFTTPFSINNT